jgi:predicted nucleic acid binding AN1-type Zn finger protein
MRTILSFYEIFGGSSEKRYPQPFKYQADTVYRLIQNCVNPKIEPKKSRKHMFSCVYMTGD